MNAEAIEDYFVSEFELGFFVVALRSFISDFKGLCELKLGS